ncbi:MAG: DUF4388 domain-containing protein [candidate division NC10 bacterium]|nr:DUF4388 domain-containing protein [candidate division NC10 bacterium]
MALEGTLKDFNLPDIFQLIGYQKKTGLLTLSRETEQVTMSLVDGMVVWATPGEEAFDEVIGRALVKRGLVTQGVVDGLTRKRREGQQGLVYLLLKQGDVSPLELQRVVEVKVREVLYRVFRWRDGRYQFTALPTLDLSQGRIDPISTENVLLEAIRQMDEWPLIQRQLPSLDLIVRKDEERLGGVDVEKLTPAERVVLELADGKSTAQDIAEASGLGEFDAAKAMADLIGDGVLVVAASEQAQRQAVKVRSAPRETPAWLFRGLVAGILAAALLLQVGLWRQDPLLLLPAAASLPGACRRAWRRWSRPATCRLASSAIPGGNPSGTRCRGWSTGSREAAPCRHPPGRAPPISRALHRPARSASRSVDTLSTRVLG